MQITGTEDGEELDGTQFADQMYGLGGDDYIFGDGGKDLMYGGAGSDILGESADGLAKMYGGSGIDTLQAIYGTFIGGGIGPFTFTFDPSHGPVITPYGNKVYHVERLDIIGGNYNDIITGWKYGDRISGWLGDDQVFGGNGNDSLDGSNGNDVLDGGNGNDFLSGGGNDDTIYGGRGNDTLMGGRSFDTFTGNDFLEGGPGADLFLAGPGQTDLSYIHSDAGVYVDLHLGRGFGGDAEGDTFDATGSFGFRGKVLGSDFDDMLVAGSAEYGRDGNDTLVASYATDLMEGGAGKDIFVFQYSPAYIADVAHITDFDQTAGKKLDVRGIDARHGSLGDQAFTFIGTDAFSGKAGELRYELQDGHTVVQMNSDKDIEVDFTFTLDGVYTLTAADFYL